MKSYDQFNDKFFKVGDIITTDVTSINKLTSLYKIDDISMVGIYKLVNCEDNSIYYWSRKNDLRLATQEEIENCDIKIQTNKYNL